MSRAMFLVYSLATLFATGCFVGGTHDSSGTITIDNGSSHVLTEIRVTAIDSPTWGPNLLPDVLYPNEQLTVSVLCDTYDVRVTDDRARDCVLGSLDLCFSDQVWTIDNSTLRNCNY